MSGKMVRLGTVKKFAMLNNHCETPLRRANTYDEATREGIHRWECVVCRRIFSQRIRKAKQPVGQQEFNFCPGDLMNIAEVAMLGGVFISMELKKAIADVLIILKDIRIGTKVCDIESELDQLITRLESLLKENV